MMSIILLCLVLGVLLVAAILVVVILLVKVVRLRGQVADFPQREAALRADARKRQGLCTWPRSASSSRRFCLGSGTTPRMFSGLAAVALSMPLCGTAWKRAVMSRLSFWT
jgi:hypothetical protein